MVTPGQLVIDSVERDFYVWVDPTNFLVRHNIGLGFFGGVMADGDDDPQYLTFTENPNRKPMAISPFQLGVIQNYRVEYNLDRLRHHSFRDFPSRLHALFLFESREDASRYREIHREHVGDRILKRAISEGDYKFSVHDGAWVDFLRMPQGMADEAIHECNESYWKGELAETGEFQSMGQRWKPQSFREALYYGRVTFPNTDTTTSD